MKVRSYNIYQNFVSELINDIIYDLSCSTMVDLAKVTELIADANALRVLFNSLEMCDSSPQLMIDSDGGLGIKYFIDHLEYVAVNKIQLAARFPSQDELKIIVRIYSRIYLSRKFREEFQPEAILRGLHDFKSRIIKSKFIGDDFDDKKAVNKFLSEWDTVIHIYEQELIGDTLKVIERGKELYQST